MRIPGKYGFVLFASLLIAIAASVGAAILLFIYTRDIPLGLIAFFLVTFLISFLILQYQLETVVYGRIKKIYKDVRFLDEKKLSKPPITTDMDMLTREVERFAQDQKLEIETLNIRENYRKEFMGNVAHELKTPLFTVQGYILTLLDGAMDDDKVRKKYLQGANKGVERLVHIVKDLDMITQLESGELILEKNDFDIVSLIQNVFDLLGMKAEKKSISLVFDKVYEQPIEVYADRDRIEQVLINLVVNSLKYGKKNGTTEIAIEDFSTSKVLVRVTDNGDGIPPENLSRIFERFYRVDKSGSRKEGGSGLGLSIVKHIVEAHLEKIYIESQLGVGSEFSLTLEKAKQ